MCVYMVTSHIMNLKSLNTEDTHVGTYINIIVQMDEDYKG